MIKNAEMLNAISKRFRTFGGGQDSECNPIVHALKDNELQFAAGVDVQQVIDFIRGYNIQTIVKKDSVIYWKWPDDKTYLKSWVQDVIQTKEGILLELRDAESIYTNYPTRVLIKDIIIIK